MPLSTAGAEIGHASPPVLCYPAAGSDAGTPAKTKTVRHKKPPHGGVREDSHDRFPPEFCAPCCCWLRRCSGLTRDSTTAHRQMAARVELSEKHRRALGRRAHRREAGRRNERW